MNRKYSFDEAVEAIDNLPNDASIKDAELIIKKTRRQDKSAVLDYVILKGYGVFDDG